MPCKPLVRRECVKRSNMQHVCRAYARTRGGTAIHVSSSPSRSSGALIGSCRASYARQATRENRVRETIQYATCVPCVACSNERERGHPRSPSHKSGALIGSCRASSVRHATRDKKRVRETFQYATCVPCIACSNERDRGHPRSPSHSSGALIGSYRVMLDMPHARRECANRLIIERAKPRAFASVVCRVRVSL
jgi:hypothetical protein